MSTNFYWKIDAPKKVVLPTGEEYDLLIEDMDPKIHIGKRSGCKGGTRFSWAQDPGRVRTICAQRGNDPIIEDEYAVVYTGAEFLKELSMMVEESADSIGQWFS